MIVLCLLLVGVTPILGTSIASVNFVQSRLGVVIGKRYLLFPPSAIMGSPLEKHKVRVGSLQEFYGGLQFDIEAYVLHPFFDPREGDNHGRTGKDNKDNIAIVIVSSDLPIGRDNVDQVDLADANFPTEGPAYVLRWGYPSGKDLSRTNITIHSKAACESTYNNIDCSRNLWGSASDSCEIERGAPVFSGHKLIGTIASSRGCENGNKNLLINSIPYFEKWIRRTIKDEEMYFAKMQ